MKNKYGIGIIGSGQHLPSNVQTNEDLCCELNDISPEWIIEKTGITQRYIASEEDTASEMALSAAIKAINDACITIEDIGLIIGCTFSHDYIFPTLSSKIQKELKATNAQVFDIQANCAGFITGLTIASDRMKVDTSIKYSVIIGIEMHTRYSNKKNKETSIFLSDGAGAVVLGPVKNKRGILTSFFHADTSAYEGARLRGGGSSFPIVNRNFIPDIDYMELNGLVTWKQAIKNLPYSIHRVCEKAEIDISQVDYFLFHQANLNLIHYIMKKIKVDLKKTFTNVEKIGNTGAASLAIVIDDALKNNKIKDNYNVLMAAVGAGYIYGASIWRWENDSSDSSKN